MSRDEIAKGIANRFVHSRSYVILYLVMASLSVTTVVLSLTSDCPTLPFYILELIINGSMIAEVSIRLVARGRVSTLTRDGYNLLRPLPVAILEITIQRHGCGPHSILRGDTDCYILCGMWQY